MSERTFRAMSREIDEVLRRYADAAKLEVKLEGEAALGQAVVLCCHTWIDPARAEADTAALRQIFPRPSNQ
jgi:hypothetical protein